MQQFEDTLYRRYLDWNALFYRRILRESKLFFKSNQRFVKKDYMERSKMKDKRLTKYQRRNLLAAVSSCVVFGGAAAIGAMIILSETLFYDVEAFCSLTLVLPYEIANLDLIEKSYDEVIMPNDYKCHYKAAIEKRNRWLAENCDLMIGYIKRESGDAYKCFSYA